MHRKVRPVSARPKGVTERRDPSSGTGRPMLSHIAPVQCDDFPTLNQYMINLPVSL